MTLKICPRCWRITEEFHLFYKQIERAQREYICLQNFLMPETENNLLKYEIEDISLLCKVEENRKIFYFNDDINQIDTNDYCEELELKIENDDDQYKIADNEYIPENDVSDVEENYQNIEPTTTNANEIPFLKEELTNAAIAKSQSKKIINEQIRDYFEMDCVLCGIRFSTFTKAQHHYRVKHQQKGYISCCGRKFFNRRLIVSHIQQHTHNYM